MWFDMCSGIGEYLQFPRVAYKNQVANLAKKLYGAKRRGIFSGKTSI